MSQRRNSSLVGECGKTSHGEALDSCEKLRRMLGSRVQSEIFQADCTKTLPEIRPDIIITDVPYGNLVEWNATDQVSLDHMLEQLWRVSHDKTILVVCMDKKQKLNSVKWKRWEKQNIGKRKFEILRRD